MAAEGDLEWEDAAADDWEVLIEGDDDTQAAAGASRDVVVELDVDTGQGKKRVQRVVITKEKRLQCQALHRVHVLCLLARLKLHDEAASGAELQALILSMLPPQHLPTSDPSSMIPDTKRQIQQLKQLVAWFGATFSPMAYADDDEGRALGSLIDAALRVKAAPVEVLVVLFVALLRGLGLLVRYVMVLDAVPLEPWRKAGAKPLRLVSVQEAKAKEAAHGRKRAQRQSGQAEEEMEEGGSKGKGKGKGKAARAQPGNAELDDEVEEAVRKLVAAADNPRAYKLKDLLSDLADQLPDIKLSKPQQTTLRKLMESVVSTLTDGQPVSGRKRGRAKAAEGAGGGSGPKRTKLGSGAAPPAALDDEDDEDDDGSGAGPSQCEQPTSSTANGDGTTAGRSNGTKGRPTLGEQEFDRELQLALMATAAEAQAREMRRMTTGIGPSSSSAPSTSTQKSLSTLRAELFGKRKGSAKAGSSTAGHVSGSRSGLVPTVWAEVYCGCEQTGRWVHVDVFNALVDKPETVEAATQRSSPVAYVVACSPGGYIGGTNQASASSAPPPSSRSHQAPGQHLRPYLASQEVKDVTNRYVSSMLGLQKVRDTAWWEATMAGFSGRPTAGGEGEAGPSGQGVSAPAVTEAKAGPSGSGGVAAAPSAGGGAGSSYRGHRAHGVHEVQARRGGSSALPEPSELRAKREDAELHQKAMSQMQGLPTSLEGFKAHPTYILKRHIGKYEALRPGAAVLGTHRGEPFYARSAVSVLHTADRWRREGREVSADQLGKPCKLVPKRKQPPPPGASRGRGYGVYSRWGGARGFGSGGSRKGSKGRQAAEEEDDDDLGEGPAEGTGGAADGPMVDLYGDWQTELWTRPEARDGVVPKNARGNVECPPLVKALPIGTVHLQYSGIWSICKALNIDYAPALVGFEVQAGRMLPKIDGVVVCEEFETQVVAAYLERETARQEALAARRRREAVSGWMHLLQAMRTRLELQARHEQPAAAKRATPPSAKQRKQRALGDDVIDLTEPGDAPPQASQREQKLQQLQSKYGSARQEQQTTVVHSSGMEVEEI